MFDTIAAISTPLGEGGIGIVRISGKEALLIADRVCRLKNRKSLFEVCSHTVNYGYVVDPATGNKIDEVLVTVMHGPRTYTGEDVVEINCHGGIVPVRKLLDMMLANGAVLAEAGEFTKRAFLNGRLDLAQAEAVIDIIRSRTEKGMDLAVSQLAGYLSSEINEIRDELLELLAYIEAAIDFPEDDIDDIGSKEIEQRVYQIRRRVERLLEDSKKGRIYREGIRMVIAGKPNVGKSSLLNALMRENRAIVTDIPGTTRDIIEEVINIKGIPVRLVDTAGIRTSGDLVEKIGVEKTLEYLDLADLILLVLDSAAELTSDDLEIIERIGNKPVVFVLNKIDVKSPVLSQDDLVQIIRGRPLVEISATLEIGLNLLEDLLAEMVLGGEAGVHGHGMVTRIRHIEALRKSARYLDQALEGCLLGVAPDLLSIDIRGAWESLGEITGDTTNQDVLDRIFAEFCIGK